MANQPEIIQYAAGVYQIEPTDPVDGGIGSITNSPLLALASRTAWLKKHIDDLESGAFAIDLYAPKNSPTLTGTPTAPTQAPGDNSTKLATDAFVQAAVNGQASVGVAGASNTTLSAAQYGVSTIILTGAITGNKSVIFPAQAGRWLVINRATGAFTLTCRTASGTGVVISQGTSNAIYCDGTNIGIDQTDFISPALSGTPTTPTPGSSDSSQQIANTAFVRSALSMIGLGDTSPSAAILDFDDATVGAGLYYVGTAAANNPLGTAPGLVLHKLYGGAGFQLFQPYAAQRILWRRRQNNTWQAWGELASLDSPAFTGSPTAPTQTSGDSSTKLATTAFIAAALASMGWGPGGVNGSLIAAGTDLNNIVTPGSYGQNSNANATLALNYPLAAVSGTLLVQAAGTQITTQKYTTHIGGRTFTRSKFSTTWYPWLEEAKTDSPTFTGTPAVPTANAGTNSNQAASTAFVQTAVADKAPLASPALTGTPTVPTAGAGTNTTQAASTAFVQAAVSDKAPLASPALTGSPTAPTPGRFLSDGALANTNWVKTRGLELSTIRSIALTVTSVNLTTADCGSLIVITGSGGGTLTLPAASSVPAGAAISIRANNTTSSTNTLKGAGTDAIGGAVGNNANSCLLYYNDSFTLVSNGSNKWEVVEEATMAFVAEKFARDQLLTANGYRKDPGGLQWQFFTSQVNVGGSSVVFPTSFTNECLAVIASGANSNGITINAHTWNKTSFSASANGGAGQYTAAFIAVGR